MSRLAKMHPTQEDRVQTPRGASNDRKSNDERRRRKPCVSNVLSSCQHFDNTPVFAVLWKSMEAPLINDPTSTRGDCFIQVYRPPRMLQVTRKSQPRFAMMFSQSHVSSSRPWSIISQICSTMARAYLMLPRLLHSCRR